MLDLSQIVEKRVPRSFEFEGEKVNIEICPHKITPEYRSRLKALAEKAKGGEEEGEEQPEQKQQDAQMVADLMPSWDVQAGGQPFPPTYANLLQAPAALLGRVSSEIGEVIKELSNPTRKKKSS